MKRLLSILICMSFLPAFADGPQAPKWEEFCPDKYMSAETVEVPEQPSHKAVAAAYLLTLPLGGLGAIPFAVREKVVNKKITEASTNNYWVERRAAFQNEISLCDSTNSDKAMCYMQVRQMETQKTSDFKHDLAITTQAGAIRSAAHRSYYCRSNGFGGTICN